MTHTHDYAAPRTERWRAYCPEEHLSSVLRRERARADRIHSGFCVVLVGLRGGQQDPKTVAKLGQVVAGRARETDEVSVVRGRFVCAVLPDTPVAGARRFVEGVRGSLNGQASRTVFEVLTYPSSPRKRDGDGHNGDGHNGDGHNGNGHNGDGRVWDGHNGNGHDDILGRAGDRDGGSETAPLVSDFVRHVSRKPARRDGRDASLDLAFASALPAWKRGMDVTVSAVVLASLLPLLALIALAIRLTSGSPVIFRQRRAGLMGRPFEIYKFRTMVVDAEARQRDLRHLSEQDGPAFKLTRDPRVTRLGGFLRKTSLDELPQLWNVLKGDMSLVGPRPLPCCESDGCSGWQRRRLDVTPGITCIWQVKGRSSVTFHEWMRMDAAYVRTRRFLYDVQLLLLTIPAVLLRRGAR